VYNFKKKKANLIIYSQVLAFMLDNASNNDTLVEGIKQCAHAEGIYIDAAWAHLRCMPHTVHLSAVKVILKLCIQGNMIITNLYSQLLEAIKVISKAEGKRASSRSVNYQDSATAPLDRTFDNIEATHEGVDIGHSSQEILPAVDKVTVIFIFYLFFLLSSL
jgi:hypothetical protein